MLVVAEVALSLVLLIGAGLTVKSFWLLLRSNPGFNPENTITMGVALSGQKYREDPPRAAFYDELMQRVKTLPGVESVAAVNHLPLGGSNSSSSFLIEGVPEPPPGQEFGGRYRVCTPGYFETMGISLVKGRAFTDQDKAGSPPVVIVSETLERRFFPGGDATGKRFRFNGPLARNPWMEIVGVVNDVRHELNLPFTGDYYLPHKQDPWENMMLVARTSSEPLALADPIRNEVLALDKTQPVFDIKTMKQVRAQSVLQYSISGTWLSIFGVVALALAAIGIYGVMSYSVSQRTHEIGVRMALGARPRDVMGMVIKQGVTLVSIGLGIGLIGGVALTSVMGSLLVGVGSSNTMTFVLVSLVLAATALVACFIPARRATKVDPMVALRYE